MSIETWGEMNKSQIDPEKIEGAIDRKIGNHNDDPDAHLADGQSLKSHRASEIIDHVARSIVNDKIIEVARAYTAILKIPSTQIENYFFSGVDYEEPSLTVVNSTKTKTEIFGRLDSGNDSEYVRMDYGTLGYNYFLTLPPVLPAGKKLYRIKVKARLKIVNPTVASMSVDFQYADGYTEAVTITQNWADYEINLLHLMDANDDWKIINQETLDAYSINLGSSAPIGDFTKNQVAISKFYIEGYAPVDIDNEDFFDFKDACDYVSQLGGGSIFIKNGTYYTGFTKTHLSSYVEIIGESLAGVVLECDDPDVNLTVGADAYYEYNTGTMTLTQNSNRVTFSGVSLTSARTVGRYLLNEVTGHWYLITAWINSTTLEIDTSYQGQTTASLKYVIAQLYKENRLANFTHNFEFSVSFAKDITIENVRQKGGYRSIIYTENLRELDCELIAVSTPVPLNYLTNSQLSDNIYKNFTQTVLYLNSASVGNIIENNLLIDNKGQCILIGSNNNLIKSNTLLNCGWTFGQLYSPILTLSTSFKNIIANNIVRKCQAYGIGSQAGANYNLVIGNIVTDNGQVGIVNNGANSITANNIV